jgi:hypothetical protein
MTAPDTRVHARIYPAARDGNDGRFTLGLVIDVISILELHRLPPPEGRDYVELQDPLFTFLYGDMR